ncbi:ATP-binding protein [Streptomyces roseirectus]|uniref:ATP-binding protein n=2 Tax=Streptomyces roseirectus TaxID=2768066 RepID=A0A7H0ISZ0_9ACTN|nr:ATP-binding protein [Streptomyces roseirectus]
MVLIPEIGRVALGRPEGDADVVAAWAGVGEARRRLDAVGDGGFPREVAHARRLARSVVCLLGHLENLCGRREAFAAHHYPTTQLAASRARTDCRKFLLACGIPVDDDFAEELTLVVDELITNAVTHGRVPGTTGRQVRLTIAHTDGVFRVEVRDTQSDKMPQLKKAGVEDGGGRGLALVDALVSTWGVVSEVIGKTVWAEKAIPAQKPT